MRLAELYGMRVVDGRGRSKGRVREVHCDGGEVTRLGLGAGTLLQRLTGGREGRLIAWSDVIAVKKDTIVVGGDRDG